MKKSRSLRLILSLFLLSESWSAASAAASQARPGLELSSGAVVLTVRAPTSSEAYAYLVRVLGDLDFLRANGYEVALPKHSAFQSPSSIDGGFEIFDSEEYRPSAFNRALALLEKDAAVLQKALDWFAAAPAVDGFSRFDHYETTLTLYGSGGSYDPERGAIILFTTPDGRFKGGGGTHTIIHEMMHLTVEGLVRRFGLNHWEKERLVDFLVQREFSELLPDYQLQSQGESALDPYLAEVPLDEIPKALERYRAERSASP